MQIKLSACKSSCQRADLAVSERIKLSASDSFCQRADQAVSERFILSASCSCYQRADQASCKRILLPACKSSCQQKNPYYQTTPGLARWRQACLACGGLNLQNSEIYWLETAVLRRACPGRAALGLALCR